MIPVEEAIEKVLASASVLGQEKRPLLECLGLVLAEDICAPLDVPPWDNSAMDGFALIAEDTRGASPSAPAFLQVVGEVAAGSFPQIKVEPGKAIRIMTGAPVPPGADTVVQFEDTDELQRKGTPSLSHIGIFKQASPGLNIRRRGEDIKAGSPVLRQGTELRAAEIGLLASLGMAEVMVFRRPVVAILATGDELVEMGQPLAPGQIYNSNTYSLACQVTEAGGVPQILGIARDRATELKGKIAQGLEADLLITSGGVSQGDYDLVKEILAQEGEVSFWMVRMRPGKPLAFGYFVKNGRRIPHLGLPGNPVSSMITFELFARPLIFKMRGRRSWARPMVEAVMQDSLVNRDGRRIYARVRLVRQGEQYLAYLTGEQGSAVLTSMAQAQGLAIIPEVVSRVEPGDRVRVMLLKGEQG